MMMRKIERMRMIRAGSGAPPIPGSCMEAGSVRGAPSARLVLCFVNTMTYFLAFARLGA
jgi:hypothetical protein